MNRKKLPVALTAVISALVILLTGTFAWQSVSQTALNEAADLVNPGGRLHDDFNGRNKDIYVENFADEPIVARIRLGELLVLTNNKGIAGVERENVLIGGRNADGTWSYAVHHFGTDSLSSAYWSWCTGGETVYMPTFNRNKDSLAADVNGTYLGPDGIVTDLLEDDRYTDYVAYEVGDEKTASEIYDGDANSVDEVGAALDGLAEYAAAGSIVLKENVTHRARPTLRAELISMADWLALLGAADGYDPQQHGNYWVYDTDGWVYWSAAIQPDTATGLLLDEISLNTVMDDSWYYAIQVTAQFATTDDVSKSSGTGFYAPGAGGAPTAAAEELLAAIGVIPFT